MINLQLFYVGCVWVPSLSRMVTVAVSSRTITFVSGVEAMTVKVSSSSSMKSLRMGT